MLSNQFSSVHEFYGFPKRDILIGIHVQTAWCKPTY